MAISPANVQEAVNVIDSAPGAIEQASMQYLQTIQSINNQVAQASTVASGASVDPSFENAMQQAVVSINNVSTVIENAKSQIINALDTTESEIEQLNMTLQSMQNVSQQVQNIQQDLPTQQATEVGGVNLASKKYFNWKKAQNAQVPESPEVPLETLEEKGQQFDSFGPFENADDLLEKLKGMDRSDAENKILTYISDPQGQEVARKTMEVVFEHSLNPQEQLEAMSQLWDYLPDAVKTNSENLVSVEGDYVNNQEQTMANLDNIRKLVEASNEEIRKKAQSNSSKSFNFKKQAQHKTNENVILWGPESRNNVDPFTGQPTSDWHVFERNKGWGFRIGDRWDIDFEAFWRGNIMDKYHRPYRDESGDWVGGYVEKRFEVDRWQPDENKYMLRPGEKRKPRPAELGNLEARIESYRGNKDQVYNWKEASNQKTIKANSGQDNTALASSDSKKKS